MLRVNREATPQYETFPVTLTGSYDSIKQTTQTLSCVLLKNTGADSYKMTVFNSDQSTFTALSDSAVSSLGFTGLDGNSNVVLGKYCWRINNAGTVYQLSADSSTYNAVSAGGSSVTATSEDMLYVMTTNVLRKYVAASNEYVTLRTYDATFTAFRVVSYSNRVLVVGVKVSGTSREQTFWLYTESNGALTLIGTFTVTGETSGAENFISYLVSPMMTKLTVTYWSSLVGDPTSLFKSSNFDTNTMTDITIED